MNVDNAQKFSTLHPRCGTSFLLVVMIVSILVFSSFTSIRFGGKLLSRIVLLPLVAGISYEIIRYSAKHPEQPAALVTLSRACCFRRSRQRNRTTRSSRSQSGLSKKL